MILNDERTVARIFWETRVLANDLVNILLETAGKGAVEDKRAIACGVLTKSLQHLYLLNSPSKPI
jgi:replication fork protection complex subunit Tof1/Swi1